MRFSGEEKKHLLKAWIAISFAFAILMGSIFSIGFIIYFSISLATVGIGFLLHELAHKYVAQRYGCWAEFRADDKMLMIAIASAFFGFIFAAPGAVWIHGHISIEKNGKISLAGPVTNIALAIVFLLLSMLLPSGGIIVAILSYGFQINSFIALFNMIPFGNFDGYKIFAWNRIIYGMTIGAAAILVILPSVLM